MARTNNLWKTGTGGTYIQTIGPSGYDVLINGTNKYLNFNTDVGTSGYGFRDNTGVMEVKSSGGAWAPIATSASGSIDLAAVSAASTTAPKSLYTMTTAVPVEFRAADTTNYVQFTKAGIGTTPSDMILLANTTAAAVGAQQYSPALHYSGFGWKTTATAASQAVDIRQYLLTGQSTTNPTGRINTDFSVNGGAYTTASHLSFDPVNGNADLTLGAIGYNGRIILNRAIDGAGQTVLQIDSAAAVILTGAGLRLAANTAIGSNFGANNTLEVRSTTGPQVRFAYNTTNYLTTDISSVGNVSFAITGSTGTTYDFSSQGVTSGFRIVGAKVIVGIGTDAMTDDFTISTNAAVTAVNIKNYNNAASSGAFLIGMAAGGTQSSPLITPANKLLFNFGGRGYDGGWVLAQAGGISVATPAAWIAGTSRPAYIGFSVTAIGSTASSEKMRLSDAGRLYVGAGVDATALVHIAAGTATASTAPLKFTSGTNLTTAEAGAMEYNGTNLFFTRSGTTRENVWCGNDGGSAPATNAIGVILDYYGTSATRVLTTPNAWGAVNLAGTVYKVPLYT